MAKKKPKPDPTTLAALTADPQNRRAHTDANLAMIATALKEVGAARSIVIDETATILAGNGVVQAARQAGLTKLRVVEAAGDEIIAVRRSGLTAAQKRALALYDNRTGELATWNVEQLLADQAAGLDLASFWDSDALAALLSANGAPKAGKTDPDAVPDVRATDIVRGDLFTLGAHRLLCGDATDAADVARVMGEDRADCVFTSPPYGVGIDYGTYQDTIENLRGLLPLLAARWHDVLVAGGFAVVNFGDIVSASDIAGTKEPCEYPMALEYWPVFRQANWILWSRRIWCKPGARTGSMQCISSNRAATNWEHVWTWKRPGKPVVARQISGEYASQLGWRDTSSEAAPEVGPEVHGAVMPVAPVLWMVSIHSRQNKVVHEPFGGSGTTLIGCEQLGRACRALEIEPQYCQVILDRWEAFTGQKAAKVGDARPPAPSRSKPKRGTRRKETHGA